MGNADPATHMTRILFLIRSLNYGGAQRQLITLLKALDKRQFAITVATFYDGGGLRPELEQIEGINVVSLSKQGRWDLLPFLWRLLRLGYDVRPHIVHGYMSVANELMLLVGRLVGARVVWGLRVSHMDFARYDWAPGLTFRFGALLSYFADLIIANSYAGRQFHVAHQYDGRRLAVVHNGIDTNHYRPDALAGAHMRERWGVPPATPLIGMVGRLDPQKDHETFLQAAALLAARRPEVRFICVGGGTAAFTAGLQEQAAQLGIAERVLWPGTFDDMPAVYNGLTLSTSASAYGEGFSNVIGESMACGVPCVVTDVGDSALVVADDDYVVPPQNPAALAECWERLLDLPAEERAARAQRVRQHIVAAYSVQQLSEKTATMLRSIAL
jgi:glycosyltransferase involved in cell wall biosynthesis